MLLLLAPLLMMKIRVGDGWTVVCSKKRQNKNSLNGKTDLGKGGFFNSGKEKGSEKERKEEELCRESKDIKEVFFQEDRSLRSGPKSVSPEKTPLSFCCAAPTPVKSGFVVPSFEDGFNLPGAVDLSVRVVRDAHDIQEEPVVGDTPPGPLSAVFLSDLHETVSGDGILAVPVFAGSRRLSDLLEKFSVMVPWPFLFFLACGVALISTRRSLMTVPWPFLLLLARGAALISTVSPLLLVSSPLLGLLDCGGAALLARLEACRSLRTRVPHRRHLSRL